MGNEGTSVVTAGRARGSVVSGNEDAERLYPEVSANEVEDRLLGLPAHPRSCVPCEGQRKSFVALVSNSPRPPI